MLAYMCPAPTGLLTTPVVAMPSCASAMNTVMMGLFAKQAVCKFLDSNVAATTLVTLTSDSVMEVYPPTWDAVVGLASTLVADNKAHLARDTHITQFVENQIGHLTLDSARIELFAYILGNLGGQMCMTQDRYEESEPCL